MASGTVTVGTGYTAGQDVLAFTNQNGITGSYSAPTLTLTGSATKANWQTALRSITYNNTSNTPNTGNRTINFVVNDGSANSNTAAKTVSVAAVNDAPVNTVPGAQTTAMNTAKVFSTGNGNLISITDVDAASGTMQVQLVSTNGATTLSTLTGLTFSVGDGTADATMTFTGTVAAVNTALAGLSFNPTTSFTGAASLQIVTSDQGNTGSGGTLTDNDTVAITVGTSTSYYDAIWGETSLLNYYRMDDSTGTAIDDIETANNNGTYSRVADDVAGRGDRRQQLGALRRHQRLRQPSPGRSPPTSRSSSGSSPLRASARSGQWPQFAGMVDNNMSGTNNDFGISLSVTGYVVAGVGNPDTTIVSAIDGWNDGDWHHVAFTRTQSTGMMTLYVDGVSRASGAGSTNTLNAVANINFGRIAAGTNYYQGNLDEIAIYSTALSGATIAAHYAAR